MIRRLITTPWLLTLVRLTRGFLFIPTLTASLGVLLALGTLWIDRSAELAPIVELVGFLEISPAGARSVLGTIAGAMMTVISLVYTLTLVVFTLAAGNLGPRLLETFSSNKVNQITIGLLGATFLYALIVLYVVGEEEAPRLSTLFAILMAAASFFWLVYFVHDVAGRVMIDNEIGRTQRGLRRAVDRLLVDADRDERSSDRDAVPRTRPEPVTADASGYVTGIDAKKLLLLAREHDGFIEVRARPGDFVIPGSLLARTFGGAQAIEAKAIRRTVHTADARAPEGDVLFNVHLLVEIAIRALSPGVNDSYTAISSIDHLSGSLALVLQRDMPSALHSDAEDTPRLWLRLVGAEEILGVALHPLRQAASGNMLVTLRLIDAIGRARRMARPERRPLVDRHLRLIAADARRTVRNRHDRRTLAEAIRAARTV